MRSQSRLSSLDWSGSKVPSLSGPRLRPDPVSNGSKSDTRPGKIGLETETNLLLPSSSSMSSASSERRPVSLLPRKKNDSSRLSRSQHGDETSGSGREVEQRPAATLQTYRCPVRHPQKRRWGKRKKDTEQRAHWREIQWFHKWIITAAGWQTIWFTQQDHQDFGGFRTGGVWKCCRPSASVFTQRQRQK